MYLELVNENHRKFYEIKILNQDVTIKFGRINCEGRSIVKSFPSSEKALIFYQKQIQKKLLKGYYLKEKPVRKQLYIIFPKD